MSREVVIEHKDGRRYGVTEANFRKLYEDDGFKVVAEADNTTPYEAPEPKATKPAAKTPATTTTAAPVPDTDAPAGEGA